MQNREATTEHSTYANKMVREAASAAAQCKKAMMLLLCTECCCDHICWASWQDYIEEEGNLELQKKRQDETNERKNAVEAYVYMLRNQLSDALSQYVTEQEQSSISSKLTDTEVRCSSLCTVQDACNLARWIIRG